MKIQDNDDSRCNLRQVVLRRIDQMLEATSSKLKDNLIIVWLLTKNTLTVVVMTLFVFSPVAVWPLLMGWPVPYCYVAYVIWIALLIGSCILAGIIGYLRETKGK